MQAPQWTDFLQCPICLQVFSDVSRLPVSLACGHTVCKSCLSNLQRRQCQFCSSPITTDIEKLPVNDALLLLSGSSLRHSPPPLESLTVDDRHYHAAKSAIESLALLMKPLSMAGTVGSSNNGILSRPMQRKLVTLINCQLVEAEGRARALRAARSLGERTVTELLLHHQNQQQLSSNLWAAVRQRGCQFLGPALQEECLRIILLALEGSGVQLSRKVLVMFVVQRLQQKEYHQASKTSVGHVVQLLYRASCFKVTKRDDESSLMELKEEFQSYEALRREHDSQIVQIAMEAGLRIAPDQWSSLLYGDTNHKSHMQSIIDKLQTPESFSHSIDELVIALTRSGDPFNLAELREYFEFLSNYNTSSDEAVADWEMCAKGMKAVQAVVDGLVRFVQANQKSKSSEVQQAYNSKYKTSMCKDMQTRGSCPRGATCSFAHSEDEMERYRAFRRGVRGPVPSRVPGQLPRHASPVGSLQPPLGPFPPGAGIAGAQSPFPPQFSGPPQGHMPYSLPYGQSPQPPPPGSVLHSSLPPKHQLIRPYPQDMITGMTGHSPSGPFSTPPQPGRMAVHPYGQHYPTPNKTYNSMPPLSNQYGRDPYMTTPNQYGGRPGGDFQPSGHSSMEVPYSDGKHSNGMYREQVTFQSPPVLIERGPHGGGSGRMPPEYPYYSRRPGPSLNSMGSGGFDSIQYGSGLDSMSYTSDVDVGEYGSHQSLTDVHSHKSNMNIQEDTAYRPPPYSHSSQGFPHGIGVRPIRPQWDGGDGYRSHDSSFSDQFSYGEMGYRNDAQQNQSNYGQHTETPPESQPATSYGAFTPNQTSKPPPSEYKTKWSVAVDHHSSGGGSPESEYTGYRSKQRQSVTVQPPEKEPTSEQQPVTEPFTVPIASSPVSTFSFSPVVGTPTSMKPVRAEKEANSPTSESNGGSLFGEEKPRRKSPLAAMWEDNSAGYGKSLWSNDSTSSVWFGGLSTDKDKKEKNGDNDVDRKMEQLKQMEEKLKKREALIQERESALAEQQKKISSGSQPELQRDFEVARSIQRQLHVEELTKEKRSSGSQPSDEELAWEVQRMEISCEEVCVHRGVSSPPQRKHGATTVYHVSHVEEKSELDGQLKERETQWNAGEINKGVGYSVAHNEGMDLVPRTPRGSSIQ